MSPTVRGSTFVLAMTLVSLSPFLHQVRVPAQGLPRAEPRGSEPAAPNPAEQASGACPYCGEERWDVKTLSDPAATTVNFTPQTATVSKLTSMRAPSSGAARHRSETKTYTVHARLVGYKIEYDPKTRTGDHDFHVVIQDMTGPQTMIVEIPDPQCAGVCTSLKRDAIAQVRADFQNGVTKPPETEFFTLKDPVEVDVTGVLFFDFAHGQRGLAKNCAELHPVLDIKFASTPTAEEDRSKEPRKHPRRFYRCLREE